MIKKTKLLGAIAYMEEISQFEARISAAFDRLGAGIQRIGSEAAGADLADLAAEKEAAEASLASATEALEAERTANAQLEERVLAIREKQEKVVARLEAEVIALTEANDSLTREVAALKSVNAQLRENNAALREANAEGVGDADLINAGLSAELEALKAAEAANRAEYDAILTELKPILEENAHA